MDRNQSEVLVGASDRVSRVILITQSQALEQEGVSTDGAPARRSGCIRCRHRHRLIYSSQSSCGADLITVSFTEEIKHDTESLGGALKWSLTAQGGC